MRGRRTLPPPLDFCRALAAREKVDRDLRTMAFLIDRDKVVAAADMIEVIEAQRLTAAQEAHLVDLTDVLLVKIERELAEINRKPGLVLPFRSRA